MCTIHANSPQQALSRLASCVLQSGVDLPYRAVRQQIADSINLVLQLDRRNGKRLVSAIAHAERYLPASDEYLLNTAPNDEMLEGLHRLVPATASDVEG